MSREQSFLGRAFSRLGYRKNIDQLLADATGQPVDESWYKYALKLAFDGRSDPATSRLRWTVTFLR